MCWWGFASNSGCFCLISCFALSGGCLNRRLSLCRTGRYFLSCQTGFHFCLDTKTKQKGQGCVCFTQKSYDCQLKSLKLALLRRTQTAWIFIRCRLLFFGSPTEAGPKGVLWLYIVLWFLVLIPCFLFLCFLLEALPQTPVTFLSWHKKLTKKSQGCVCFASKSYDCRLKSRNSSFYNLVPRL